MMRLAKFLFAGLAALAGTIASASAADLVAVRVDDPGVCAKGAVLGMITKRFQHQVRNVPHLPRVAIADFYRIGESLHLPRQHDRPIDRRYCHAKVALSNGGVRDIWYLIERPMGFAGVGSNVEFCVSGFDRWNVYDGRCRVLRPALW